MKKENMREREWNTISISNNGGLADSSFVLFRDRDKRYAIGELQIKKKKTTTAAKFTLYVTSL